MNGFICLYSFPRVVWSCETSSKTIPELLGRLWEGMRKIYAWFGGRLTLHSTCLCSKPGNDNVCKVRGTQDLVLVELSNISLDSSNRDWLPWVASLHIEKQPQGHSTYHLVQWSTVSVCEGGAMAAVCFHTAAGAEELFLLSSASASLQGVWEAPQMPLCSLPYPEVVFNHFCYYFGGLRSPAEVSVGLPTTLGGWHWQR